MRKRFSWFGWALILAFLLLRLVKSVFAEEKSSFLLRPSSFKWQLIQEREENLKKQINSFNNILRIQYFDN